jgi:hypothetical protein
MLLLMNVEGTQVIRPTFKNKTSAGFPVFGIYQWAPNIVVVQPTFLDCNGFCIYYSVTCDNLVIDTPTVTNCGTFLQGSNVSDNGVFDSHYRGLRVYNPTITGGANSLSSHAFEIGASDDVLITNPVISEYQIAFLFTKGNGLTVPSTNWVITNPTIKNNNPEDTFHSIHGAIQFQEVGGNMNGYVIGGRIFDDQASKTQRYPVVFTGTFAWTNIFFINTLLFPYKGASPIQVDTGTFTRHRTPLTYRF